MKNHKFIVKHGIFYGWHMLPPSRRLRFGDHRIANDNQTLTVPNNHLIACAENGLHMAITPAQAISWSYDRATLLCRVIGQGTHDIGNTGETAAFEKRTILWSIDIGHIKNELRKVIGEQLVEHCSEPIDPQWKEDISQGTYQKYYSHYKRMKMAGGYARELARIIRPSTTIYDILAAGTLLDQDYLFVSPLLEDIVNTILAKNIPNYSTYLDGSADEYIRR